MYRALGDGGLVGCSAAPGLCSAKSGERSGRARLRTRVGRCLTASATGELSPFPAAVLPAADAAKPRT
jgi:hypothetical protein